MKILVLLAIVAVLVVLRLRKTGLLVSALASWVGFYIAVRFGFTVPIPASVIGIYMGIATIALVAYVTSSAQRRDEFSRPLIRLMTEAKLKPLLVAVVLLIPALAAANVYFRMSVPIEAPLFSRTVHPASPGEIVVHDKTMNLNEGENPYRHLETSSPEDFAKHLESGRRTYYRNCVFCHGDSMAGNGMFIHGLNPIPTDFTDSGTIPMFQETYLYWRVAKGGPGLPEEGAPWDSAMPSWERFLTDEEMWDVILFLYDFTGTKPRAREHDSEHK